MTHSPDLVALFDKCQRMAEQHREWIHERAESIGYTAAAFVELLDAIVDVDVDDVAAFLAERGLLLSDFVERVRSLVETAEPFAYLAEDPALYVTPDAPFDPTWTRPRMQTGRGVEVRGRRDGYVIGDTNRAAGERQNRDLDFGVPARDGDYVRMPYSEALERANAWHYMATGETLPMIGTDTYSWEEVVTWRPYTFTLADGSLFVERAEGAGSSIVGNVNRRPSNSHNARPNYNGSAIVYTVNRDGKKRRTTVRLSVPRPEQVTYNDAWPFDSVRVVKQYRTTFAGRYCVGHGSWTDTTSTTKKKRAAVAKKRNTVPTVDVDAFDVDVVAAIAANLTTSYRDGTTTTTKVRAANGTTVTVGHEPSNRRYRVTVTNGDGRRMTTVRSLAAVVTTIGRAVDVDTTTVVVD